MHSTWIDQEVRSPKILVIQTHWPDRTRSTSLFQMVKLSVPSFSYFWIFHRRRHGRKDEVALRDPCGILLVVYRKGKTIKISVAVFPTRIHVSPDSSITGTNADYLVPISRGFDWIDWTEHTKGFACCNLKCYLYESIMYLEPQASTLP